VVVDNSTIDYSRPIVLSSPIAASQAAPAAPQSDGSAASTYQPSPADQAMELLDTARTVFSRGDYAEALADCNQAVAKLPNCTAAHEFRGLTLFALGRYKEAAGPVYAVLSVGPGWDWNTLKSFYPREDVYVQQLRALEQYVQSSPNVAEARFLLAYHYITGGHNDAAAEQLQSVVQLNPQDQLSAQLLRALTKTAAPEQPPKEQAATSTPAAAKPVDASALAGNWKAVRPDGASILLGLGKDATYSWKFTEKDKTQEFSGTYTVANNLLILNENNAPVMIGQVTMLPGNGFNFKLPGGNSSDPGLTFSP
jgi:tetratricopeptide (TPR) repeat protein